MSQVVAEEWVRQWDLRPDTTYLNHGSFGPPPRVVRQQRARFQQALDEQPMDFFVRQHEPLWRAARERLASWLHSAADNLVFVENATYGMNVVAQSFPLEPGDEVLLTDHEYGAVMRIWQRATARAGAAPPRVVRLPQPLGDVQAIVDCVLQALSPQTKLLVVSHITSATAVILPVEAIVRAVQARGVRVCVDGPHAPAQVPLQLDPLGADYYTASLHKWLCAPFGSGFLHVHPQHQAEIATPLLSWGRLDPQARESWDHEFIWTGTRDASAYLAIPAAIDFLESVGWERFRRETHALAQVARQRLVALTGLEPLVPDSPDWYGCMAHVPLPPGDRFQLQKALWERARIEVPIVDWDQRRWIRVSCHLYNHESQIELLLRTLDELLRAGL